MLDGFAEQWIELDKNRFLWNATTFGSYLYLFWIFPHVLTNFQNLSPSSCSAYSIKRHKCFYLTPLSSLSPVPLSPFPPSTLLVSPLYPFSYRPSPSLIFLFPPLSSLLSLSLLFQRCDSQMELFGSSICFNLVFNIVYSTTFIILKRNKKWSVIFKQKKW